MKAEPKRDPMPLDQMPPKERAEYVRMLRKQAETTPYDPDDDSLEILALAVTPTEGKAH